MLPRSPLFRLLAKPLLFLLLTVDVSIVLAVYNYTEFDQQIGESAGAECKAALQETTQLIEQKLATNGRALRASFSADDDVYAKYVKDYYLGTFGVNAQINDQKYLKKTAITEDSSSRLWWLQVCTEVAYFQVAPSNDSVRSSKVDTRYHLDLCKNVFGEGVFPEVDTTNLYYGGTKIAGSKIIFTNGSQDPWRHASKQISSPNMPSYTITCYNCGHCTDIRGCPQSPLVIEGNEKNCTSPDAVHKVRQKIQEHMDLWLSECQDTGKSFI